MLRIQIIARSTIFVNELFVKSLCAYSDDIFFVMKNGLDQHVRFFLAEKPLKSQVSGLFE